MVSGQHLVLGSIGFCQINSPDNVATTENIHKYLDSRRETSPSIFHKAFTKGSIWGSISVLHENKLIKKVKIVGGSKQSVVGYQLTPEGKGSLNNLLNDLKYFVEESEEGLRLGSKSLEKSKQESEDFKVGKNREVCV
jgi:DNA-binding PadR family transcriptional regulator